MLVLVICCCCVIRKVQLDYRLVLGILKFSNSKIHMTIVVDHGVLYLITKFHNFWTSSLSTQKKSEVGLPLSFKCVGCCFERNSGAYLETLYVFFSMFM